MVAGFLFCDFHSRAAFRGRAFRVSELPQHGCQSCMSAGRVRLQSNRFPQSSHRILELALLLQHCSKRVIGLGIVRFGMNCCAEFLRGCGKVALLPKRHSERVVHIRLPRIQFCGLVQFGHGFRQFVF